MLGRPKQEKRQEHTFAYRGLIRCGACGLQITAEHKVNRWGKRYTYYHCTRVHRTPRCLEPSIEAKDLEKQIRAALERITLPEQLRRWSLRQLAANNGDRVKERELQVEQTKRSVQNIEEQIRNLTGLRIRALIDDAEFMTTRQSLQSALRQIQEAAQSQSSTSDPFEPSKALISFRNKAIYWFDKGNGDVKRKVLEIVSSNPTLKDKKFSVEAKKPFFAIEELPGCSRLRAAVDAVRTPGKHAAVFLSTFQKTVREYDKEHPKELATTVAAIQELEKEFEGFTMANDNVRLRRRA